MKFEVGNLKIHVDWGGGGNIETNLTDIRRGMDYTDSG
jgi:hypothetical protein